MKSKTQNSKYFFYSNPFTQNLFTEALKPTKFSPLIKQNDLYISFNKFSKYSLQIMMIPASFKEICCVIKSPKLFRKSKKFASSSIKTENSLAAAAHPF